MVLTVPELLASLEAIRARPLPHHEECSVCASTEDLDKCEGCGLVFFCRSGQHKSEQASHTGSCDTIKYCESLRDKSDRKLREFTDASTPPSSSSVRREVIVCNFFRYTLVRQLVTISTRPAMTRALSTVQKMLEVAGASFTIVELYAKLFRPLVAMRLGHDQLAYDCSMRLVPRGVVVFTNGGEFRVADWDSQHFLIAFYDTKYQLQAVGGRHVFESLELFRPDNGATELHDFLSDSMNYAHLLLHKIKALLCLQSMDHVDLLARKIPPELLCHIRFVMATTTMANDAEFARDVVTDKDMESWKRKLEVHIRALFNIVDAKRPWLWPAFIDIGCLVWLTRDESAITKEAFLLTYAVFKETPGAFEWITSYIRSRISPEEFRKRGQAALRKIQAEQATENGTHNDEDMDNGNDSEKGDPDGNEDPSDEDMDSDGQSQGYMADAGAQETPDDAADQDIDMMNIVTSDDD